MTKTQKQFATNKLINFYAIDIIKLVLSFVILNYHCYKEYYAVAKGISVGGGWLACDCFFMMSGFFCALSALKDNSKSFVKYSLNRVLKMVPLLVLVWLEGLLFTLILYFVKGKEFFFAPFNGANGALWFIWSLWVGEILLYPVVKYAKKHNFLYILLITCAFLGFYVFLDVVFRYNIPIAAKDFPMLGTIEGYVKGIADIGLGIILYFIYRKIQGSKYSPSKAVKTFCTTLSVLMIGACVYIIFWQYATSYIFLFIGLFFILLIISFNKIGWISSSMKLNDKFSKFCKTYSLTLYLYHHALVSFIGAFSSALTATACGGISIASSLVLSVPFYFLAPKFTSFIISKSLLIIEKIKAKRQAKTKKK